MRLLCTLEDAELLRRGAEWRSLLAAAVERVPTSEGVRLVFPTDERTAEHLESLIARESECCAWMTFMVERTDEAILVTVSGPAASRAALASAFAAGSV